MLCWSYCRASLSVKSCATWKFKCTKVFCLTVVPFSKMRDASLLHRLQINNFFFEFSVSSLVFLLSLFFLVLWLLLGCAAVSLVQQSARSLLVLLEWLSQGSPAAASHSKNTSWETHTCECRVVASLLDYIEDLKTGTVKTETFKKKKIVPVWASNVNLNHQPATLQSSNQTSFCSY